MARPINARNSNQLLAEIKKYSDGTKTITEVCRYVKTSHCWAKKLILQHNIPYKEKVKRLTDVQMYQIRKQACPYTTIKQLAREVNGTYYAVKMYCDENNIPYKSYAKDKVIESEIFTWEMFNFNVY